MNASLNIPPKLIAVFSKREKTRRLSLSQPISRSMIFRRRYAWLSNSTGRAARPSFSFDGMTGVISSVSRYWSIQSARKPLSPASATGHATGLPSASRISSSAPESRSSSAVDSWAWPGVRMKWSGCPWASHNRWTFVVNPPRERPNA